MVRSTIVFAPKRVAEQHACLGACGLSNAFQALMLALNFKTANKVELNNIFNRFCTTWILTRAYRQ